MDAGATLHVTNGDVAADLIQQAGLPGRTLPWRDVLHEGPVPAGLDRAVLAEVRARYLAERGWAPYETIVSELRAREETLARAVADPTIELVLWFESDLYDQLQLVQILDRLAGERPAAPPPTAVDVGSLPGVGGFRGIGECDVAQIRRLYDTRREVPAAAYPLGRAAWSAFTAADPAAIEALLAADTSALPDLAPALRRHLEQFPAVGDGLSRAERQLMLAVAGGARTPAEAFVALAATEERPFLGDAIAWDYLADLGRAPHPLLGRPDRSPLLPPDGAFPNQPLALTEIGRAVLAGRADRVALAGLDRWLGGVHLTGPTIPWRWDAAAGRLTSPGS
jgi:hypothetical protein